MNNIYQNVLRISELCLAKMFNKWFITFKYSVMSLLKNWFFICFLNYKFDPKGVFLYKQAAVEVNVYSTNMIGQLMAADVNGCVVSTGDFNGDLSGWSQQSVNYWKRNWW